LENHVQINSKEETSPTTAMSNDTTELVKNLVLLNFKCVYTQTMNWKIFEVLIDMEMRE
jgi:hypothetical protein